MTLSIVVPVHNEGAVVGPYVRAFQARLAAPVRAELAEVLLVENGSRDDTMAACRTLEREFPGLVRALSTPVPSYGEAVRLGLLESRGTHVAILEVDFLDPAFVERSLRLLQEGAADLVLASKRHPESVDRRPLQRRVLTWGFNVVLRLLFGYPGTDTHGLKSMEGTLAKRLCELAMTRGETFQTEIVLIAWRLGLRIEEVPIQIVETRAAPISVRRRLPGVIAILKELRRSLRRFA